MLIVTYRCPSCRNEHKHPLVTKTQFYICTNCEAKAKASAQVAALAVQQELPVQSVPEKKTVRKSKKTTTVTA